MLLLLLPAESSKCRAMAHWGVAFHCPFTVKCSADRIVPARNFEHGGYVERKCFSARKAVSATLSSWVQPEAAAGWAGTQVECGTRTLIWCQMKSTESCNRCCTCSRLELFECCVQRHNDLVDRLLSVTADLEEQMLGQ